MKRILSFFLIGMFLASTIGAGVCVAKANHYDYKVVGEDGTSYEITGKFGNYNENQDHTSNRVTVYNADVYDSEGNYVGKADVVNWNKNSNNGAHAKWRVEETTPVVDDNNTSEEVNTTEEVTPEPVANVTEEVVNNTTEVVNDTEPVANTTEEPVANTTDDNDVIGSGTIEIDDNGTIINGTAVIPDDGHMCDNVSLSNASSKVAHNNATHKVANKTTDNSTNSTVADDNNGRSIDLSNFRTGSTIDLLIIALIVCVAGGLYTWRRNH